MSRSGRSSRPLTNLSLSRNPTPRRHSAGGDTISLDEELSNVLQKEYDEGKKGHTEAIQDARSVLKEVAQEPIAQAMDRVMPRFLSPEAEEMPPFGRPPGSAKKRNKAPRHAMLTARPPARGKEFQIRPTETTASVPNISEGAAEGMRLTPSAPTIASSTRNWSSSSSYVTEKTSRSNLKVTGMEETEGLPRTATALSSLTEASVPEDESRVSYSGTQDDELPYTENLLEMPSDSEDVEDVWKSDLVELTKMKSAPKKKSSIGTDTLELKYKEPEWPHQLFLNQILVKLPRLTHLVLDGSELRFLRDLGTSLMSLLTLSVCDCGLRSLDGAHAMPNLRTLIARKNKITVPTQCSFLNRLTYLDLSSNPIKNFDEFTHLRQCSELRIIKLHDTPIASAIKFQKRMKRHIPQLKEIHPPYFDTDQFLLIRKEGEQLEEETKEADKKQLTSSMPNMSYDKVMQEEAKPGLAYQQIPIPKGARQPKVDDVTVRAFMGPKFIQHLEDTIPPPTAEPEKNTSEHKEQGDNPGLTEVDIQQQKVFEEIFRKK